MELNEEQKQEVRKWASEGCKLSEIQRRLKDEFDMAMTYMDVRFLILDLGIELKEEERRREPSPNQNTVHEPDFQQDNTPGSGTMDQVLGGVTVSIDRVKKPGALASGRVTFSDGEGAAWSLDQMGRLGLNPDKEGYMPSEEDVQSFQMELQSQIQKSGF